MYFSCSKNLKYVKIKNKLKNGKIELFDFQNLERRNVERFIFRNFEIANIRITKDELFDSFIIDFFFIFYKFFEQHKYLVIFQMVN